MRRTLGRRVDNVKAAIEGKILDAIKPVKWRTLKVGVTSDTKGIDIVVAIGNLPEVHKYRITVKKVRMQ